MFLLLQAVQLFPVFHPVQDAAAVEEYHPHSEYNERDGVFIDEDFQDLFQLNYLESKV